jgi:hypothetical protein
MHPFGPLRRVVFPPSAPFCRADKMGGRLGLCTCASRHGRDRFQARFPFERSPTKTGPARQPEHGDKRGLNGGITGFSLGVRSRQSKPLHREKSNLVHGVSGSAPNSFLNGCENRNIKTRKEPCFMSSLEIDFFSGQGKKGTLKREKRLLKEVAPTEFLPHLLHKGPRTREDASSALPEQIGVTFGGCQGAQPPPLPKDHCQRHKSRSDWLPDPGQSVGQAGAAERETLVTLNTGQSADFPGCHGWQLSRTVNRPEALRSVFPPKHTNIDSSLH